jgi:hypothetical protein
MPVATARMLGSKMMSSGGKPTPARSAACRRACRSHLALERVGLALLVEGHDDDGGAVARTSRARRRNSASPSFSEIELTMPLPCTHLRPASITATFEESIITGTRAISGSAAIRLRNLTIVAAPSISPSSMLTSMMLAPFSTCWRAIARHAPMTMNLRGGGAGGFGIVGPPRQEMTSGSRPLRRIAAGCGSGSLRGGGRTARQWRRCGRASIRSSRRPC